MDDMETSTATASASSAPSDIWDEFSWRNELFNNKYNLVPAVRNQGNSNTCVFQALSGTAEMESKLYAAQRNYICTRKFMTESFIKEYEMAKGKIPNDITRKTRLAAALEYFRTVGVLSEVNGETERIKLSSYESKSGQSFAEIAAIIGKGRPIVGSFRIDTSFVDLPPETIYKYNNSEGQRTDAGDHCSHAVVFIGFGWAEAPYLVFLNSHGVDWCDKGFGRVDFRSVRDLFTIDLDFH